MITPLQCRMARTALDLGVRELAALAKVAPGTISRFEQSDKPSSDGKVVELKERTIEAIQATLEAQGIEFFNGTGVKLHLKQ